jgi:uncharacterized protein (DUF427 family)
VTDEPNHPLPLVPAGEMAPCARRVRGVLGATTIFDTTRARYVWEFPPYPQYYIPLEDIADGVLVDEDHPQQLKRGLARRYGLRVGDVERPAGVRVYGPDADAAVAGHARFEWDALDAWYEEDEQIFVHPRNPYVRVDALRSRRVVRVELDGVVLAESDAPVLVFETGLPARTYFDRTAVAFEHLQHTDTQTKCPYKGTTSDYWTCGLGTDRRDIAWSYNFPTAALLPITGLVAFFDERVDTYVDGELQERPHTPYS